VNKNKINLGESGWEDMEWTDPAEERKRCEEAP
jgi:hypothetical protein